MRCNRKACKETKFCGKALVAPMLIGSLSSAPMIGGQDTNTNHLVLHLTIWRLVLDDQLVSWSDCLGGR
jgi:hypothetical protein